MQLKKKITYIISDIDKAIAFEWIVERLKNQFDFHFILIGQKKGYLFEWLKDNKISAAFIKYSGKKDLPYAWLKTLFLLKNQKTDIVHTHLFTANLIGLTTAKLLGIKKRIHTRHHSTFHHDKFPKAVKWDLRINKWSTDIIAISENVQKILVHKENVPDEKIHLIHHGFDINAFENVSKEPIAGLIKKYNIPDTGQPIIGCISRYINWKGVEFIIDAFKKLTSEHPNAHLVLANAKGPDQQQIKYKLSKTLEEGQYTEIQFENNLFALYQLFDIYVHVPINDSIEAFGQTYVEALAAGIPSIFTLSGVALEFIEHKKNAWVVDYKNIDAIHLGMQVIIEDTKVRNTLIENGTESVKPFSLNLFIEKLAKLYET